MTPPSHKPQRFSYLFTYWIAGWQERLCFGSDSASMTVGDTEEGLRTKRWKVRSTEVILTNERLSGKKMATWYFPSHGVTWWQPLAGREMTRVRWSYCSHLHSCQSGDLQFQNRNGDKRRNQCHILSQKFMKHMWLLAGFWEDLVPAKNQVKSEAWRTLRDW